MGCSLRKASREEQSITPKKAFFGPIGTTKRAQNSLHKSSFGVSETA